MWHEERLLIDGELRHATGNRTFETVDPSSGAVLGTAADATLEDAREATAAARRAFDHTEWATDLALRVRCIRQFRDALDRHRDDLRELIVVETGAPRIITYGGGLDTAIDTVSWYGDLAEKYEFTTDYGDRESHGGVHHRWVEREPVGVAALIVPYNFPVLISLNKLAPAMAAGCTSVLKGPPDAPWSTAALGALIATETDTPAGVVNVLNGSAPELGATLTTDPMVDMVSFTGSTATGRRIMAAASDTVKRLFLELGGKSALIVLDDADFPKAAATAARAVCAHAGQGCSLTTRLLLPRSRFEEGVELVREIMSQIPYGDPRDAGVMMGPLISERQRQKVHGMVQDAVGGGAKVLLGGGIPQQHLSGYYFEPTLLVDVEPGAAIAQEELFGPVLVAIPFDDDDDAVAIANDSIYGLSGMIWSGDPERARRVARRIRTGTMSINGAAWYGPDIPFGGFKQSGFGREMGVAGLEEYLEIKATAEPAS